jgi:hypothetical protein
MFFVVAAAILWFMISAVVGFWADSVVQRYLRRYREVRNISEKDMFLQGDFFDLTSPAKHLSFRDIERLLDQPQRPIELETLRLYARHRYSYVRRMQMGFLIVPLVIFGLGFCACW